MVVLGLCTGLIFHTLAVALGVAVIFKHHNSFYNFKISWSLLSSLFSMENF